MAGKIKGITVEIGGDTTKLGKALKEVDKQSKTLQTELKGVNTLLKMDPSNVNLIKQKQDLLNESIANTKEKLTTLKSTQEQVQAQFDKGEITAEQYRDFQREIASTENKLNALSKEAKDFGTNISASLVSAQTKLNEFGGKAEAAGKAMLPVTAAVVAVGTAGVAAFNAVDDGADNVIKATGAVGEAAEGLAKSYENVASNIVGEFETIGSALGEVNTRFGYTGEELEACTEKFMKFSEITGTDATAAVQLVARAMGDAGIDSSEYASVLDSLAVAAQASGISIDKLTENLTKYGAPMRALGYDASESIAIFSSWEKAGVNTEIAFSGMKKAISNFAAEGKGAKVEFANTLETIAACPDIASATTKAIEIFGAKAGPDLADAIQGGRFEFQEMLDIIAGADGTVDGTFDELVDGGYEAELAMQNMKLALSGIGETIMSMLAPIIASIAEKLRQFKGWWDSLSPSMQKVIVVVGGIVAAIGPVLIIVRKVTTGISSMITLLGTIKTAIITVKTAFMAFNAVLLANPIVLVIAAIVALIAIFVTLWNKCEGFRNFWINLWEIIKSAVASGIESVKNWFNDAGQYISIKLTEIGTFFSNLWTGITQIFSVVGTWFTDRFNEAWNGIKNVFSTVGGFFTGVWNTITGIFTSIAVAIGDAVSGAFRSAVNAVIGFASNTINGFIRGINSAIGLINKIPGVNLGRLGYINIPMMAKGGTLHEGQAIVAEAGPEMIQLLNGKAVVTPLSSKAKNTAVNQTSSNGTGNISGSIENKVYLDGKIVARSTNKNLGKTMNLRRRGLSGC